MTAQARQSTPAVPVDWPMCITRIKNRMRCGNRKVAVKVGCDEAVIGRLERGEIREPRFTTGLMLLDLHLDLCPDEHATLLDHR